jgi:hypothetical protein
VAGPLIGSLLTRLEMPPSTFFYVTAIGPLLSAGCFVLLLKQLGQTRSDTAAAATGLT